MKIIKIFLLITFFLSVLITGCKDNYEYIDYEKLAADELKLLESFYKSKMFDSIIVYAKDTFKTVSGQDSIITDTLDKRSTMNLFMARTFRKKNDKGRPLFTDSIKSGQVAGYRYTLYYINTVESNSIDAPLLFTNRSSNEPDYYIAGNYTNTSIAMSYGIDYAIRNMFFLDRCTVIMPSSIGAQSILGSYAAKDRYKIIIADIEVTYISR